MFQRAAVTARVHASRSLAVRQLHASPVPAKSATEKVKEVADKVNKKVGKGLASAIETGEGVTEKTKETIGTTKEKAEGAKDELTQKTKETAEQAAQKKNELKSDANSHLRS